MYGGGGGAKGAACEGVEVGVKGGGDKCGFHGAAGVRGERGGKPRSQKLRGKCEREESRERAGGGMIIPLQWRRR